MSAPESSLLNTVVRQSLQDAGAGEDVSVRHDRPEVLRIDHLGAPWHLQHEVGETRPERRQDHPLRRRDPRALVGADEMGVRERAGMRVVDGPLIQPDEVRAIPLVHQQHLFPGAERPGHRGTPP